MKEIKKCIAVLLTAIITLSNINGIGSVKEVKAANTATAVEVKNYNFESTTTNSSGKLIAKDWSTNSCAEVVSTGGIGNSKCLKITNSSSTVNEVTQKLQLEENTEYVLTGYIKGQNISGQNNGGDFGDGATIDFDENTAYMVDHTNNWKKGTFDWTKVTVYFITDSTGKVTLRCRLGHMWGTAQGTAYFDNISIEKKSYPNDSSVDRVKIESGNVRGYITKDVVNEIGMDKYKSWLNKMQEAYEAYGALTGSCPFYGDVINIINTEEPMIQQYGAIANFNPILHNRNQIDNFKRFAEQGYVNFGDLHEIGHSFDKKSQANSGDYGWNFNGEFWANTKMLYVLDCTDDITLNMNGVIASSSQEMGKYYKEVAGGGYNNSIAKGQFNDNHYDALTYIFIKLVQKIGWEPFKETFRQYVNGEVITPSTTLAKFDKFIYLLQQNYKPNGTEVMDCITERDYQIIKEGMKTSYDSTLDTKKQEYYNTIDALITSGKYQERFLVILKEARKNIEHAGSTSEMQQYYNEMNSALSKVKTVTFKNYDGTVLKVEQVISGESATPPTASKKGYTFTGWDKSYTQITADTVLTAQFKATENKVVIYYKGFDNAYIHYQIGSGTWTKVPGEAMDPFTGLSGFNYKAEIDLGTAKNMTCCFNDGKGNWDNNSSKNYTFSAGYYTFTASAGTKIKEIEAPELSARISSLTTDYPAGVTVTSKVKISAKVSDAEEGTTYSYYAVKDGQTTKIAENTTSLTTNWTPSAAGTYTLKMEAKYDGKVVDTKNISIVVNDRITLTPPTGATDIYQGKEATFSLSATGGTGKITYTYYYTTWFGSNEIMLQSSTSPTLKWKPTETGTYQLWYKATDEGGYQTGLGYIAVNVLERESKTVIYYSGFSNPRIHYQIGNGSWTAVPGVAMEKSNEVSGFGYKVVIDLGDEDVLTACFNDGNGNWDSNNQKNYKFGPGYYTYKNGVITEIEKPIAKLNVTSLTSNFPKGITGCVTVTLTATVADAQGSVAYTFTDTAADGTTKTIKADTTSSEVYWIPSSYGTHVITVTATDGVTTATKTMNINVNEYMRTTFTGETTIYVGVPAEFTLNTTGGTGEITYTYYYTQWPSNTEVQLQSSTNNTLIWTPEKTGTYQLYYKVADEGGESTVVGYRTITVMERPDIENKTVIYYSGFENPYIHYQIGTGSWTAVPGVPMEKTSELEGYAYKIEIDLGDADKLTACFNDGNNHWDNNNSNDYRFAAGYYAVKNGQITKIK